MILLLFKSKELYVFLGDALQLLSNTLESHCMYKMLSDYENHLLADCLLK